MQIIDSIELAFQYKRVTQLVLTSNIHRTKTFCDQDSLPQELEFLTSVFKMNRYSQHHIRRAMLPTTPANKTEEEPTTATAYLPYVQTIYGRLSRMLSKYNIMSIALPPKKISSFLPPVKQNLGLRTLGIYSIPCECGMV